MSIRAAVLVFGVCLVMCCVGQKVSSYYDLPSKLYQIGKGKQPVGIAVTESPHVLYFVWPASVESHIIAENGTIGPLVASVTLTDFTATNRYDLVHMGENLFLLGVAANGTNVITKVHLDPQQLTVTGAWKLTETPPLCFESAQAIDRLVMADETNALVWGYCTLYHYSLNTGGELTLVHKLDGLTMLRGGFVYTDSHTQQQHLVIQLSASGLYIVNLVDFTYVKNDKVGVKWDELRDCEEIINLQPTTVTSPPVRPALFCSTQYSYPCSFLFTYSMQNDSWTKEGYMSCPWRYLGKADLSLVDPVHQIAYFSVTGDGGASNRLMAYNLRNSSWFAEGTFGQSWPYEASAGSAVLSADGTRLYAESAAEYERDLRAVYVVKMDQFFG